MRESTGKKATVKEPFLPFDILFSVSFVLPGPALIYMHLN